MKVIGVNASPRGKDSNTLRLVNAVLEGAKDEGADTEFIDLHTLRIEYCTACGTCYATGECTLLDDFSDLFDRIMNADGIILGAPNYIDSVPAPMKAFFDRMADAIHCQMLTGKFGCSVCTAGGAGEAEVVGYMNKGTYHAWRNRRGRSGRRDRQGSGRHSGKPKRKPSSGKDAGPFHQGRTLLSRTGRDSPGRNGSTSASLSSTTRTGSPTIRLVCPDGLDEISKGERA